MFPVEKEIKAKINYWDYIKIKGFYTVKETINKTKSQPTEWEKIYTSILSDKVLVSKICKEVVELNTQNPNNLIKMDRRHQQT